MARPTRKASPWMRSTFEPRQFPEAIALRDEHIVFGPFCVHCGAPRVEHSKTGRCPRNVAAIYPPPACRCHGVGDKRQTAVR